MTSDQSRRRKRESPEKRRNRLVAEVRQLRQDEFGALRRIADAKDALAERHHEATLRGIRDRRDQLVPQIERLSARIEQDQNAEARTQRKRRSGAKRSERESRPHRGVPGRPASNPA